MKNVVWSDGTGDLLLLQGQRVQGCHAVVDGVVLGTGGLFLQSNFPWCRWRVLGVLRMVGLMGVVVVMLMLVT